MLSIATTKLPVGRVIIKINDNPIPTAAIARSLPVNNPNAKALFFELAGIKYDLSI